MLVWRKFKFRGFNFEFLVWDMSYPTRYTHRYTNLPIYKIVQQLNRLVKPYCIACGRSFWFNKTLFFIEVKKFYVKIAGKLYCFNCYVQQDECIIGHWKLLVITFSCLATCEVIALVFLITIHLRFNYELKQLSTYLAKSIFP